MIAGRKKLFGIILCSVGAGLIFSTFISSDFFVVVLGCASIITGIYLFKCCY